MWRDTIAQVCALQSHQNRKPSFMTSRTWQVTRGKHAGRHDSGSPLWYARSRAERVPLHGSILNSMWLDVSSTVKGDVMFPMRAYSMILPWLALSTRRKAHVSVWLSFSSERSDKWIEDRFHGENWISKKNKSIMTEHLNRLFIYNCVKKLYNVNEKNHLLNTHYRIFKSQPEYSYKVLDFNSSTGIRQTQMNQKKKTKHENDLFQVTASCL